MQRKIVIRFLLYALVTILMTTLVIAFTYFYQLNIFRNEGELEVRSKLMTVRIGIQTMEEKAIADLETISKISGSILNANPLGVPRSTQRLLVDFMRFNPDYEQLILFDLNGESIGVVKNIEDSTYFQTQTLRITDLSWYEQEMQSIYDGVSVSPAYTQSLVGALHASHENYIDILKVSNNDDGRILFVLKMNISKEIKQLEFDKSFDYDLYIANQNGNLIFTSDSTWKDSNNDNQYSHNSLKFYFPEMFSKIVNDSIEFYRDGQNNYQIRYYQSGLREDKMVLRENRIVVVKVPRSNTKLLQLIDFRLFSLWAILFVISALFVFYRLAKYQVENEVYKKDLEKSQKELRNNLQSQTNFFAVLSHDLKNSIGSAQAYSEYIEESIDSFERQELKEHLKTIRKSLQGQFKMLINILQWSRTELGINKMLFETCHVQELILDLKSFFMLKLKNKKIDLIIEVDNKLSLDCDPNSITSILRNVVDNAIKYSYENSEIIISAHSNKNEVEIIVQDFGVGIPEKHLPKLFEIDSKLGTKGTKNEESTGFGLKLINALVSKCDGNLKVESEEGKGTSFVLIFPKYHQKS